MKIRHQYAVLALTALAFGNALTAFAASGDLVLYDTNVTFSTSFFLEGSDIKIKASVQNNSPNDLLGSVRFQTQVGNIGSDQPISALGGKTDDVFVIYQTWFC